MIENHMVLPNPFEDLNPCDCNDYDDCCDVCGGCAACDLCTCEEEDYDDSDGGLYDDE
jgi:hypothetical protein